MCTHAHVVVVGGAIKGAEKVLLSVFGLTGAWDATVDYDLLN